MTLAHDWVPARRGARAEHAVVVLHGLGDSRHGWKPVAPMLGLDHVAWCFAEAPLPYHGGWAWFDLEAAWAGDFSQIDTQRTQLHDLIATIGRDHGVPCARLALMGFSQGCVMAVDAALSLDQELAGVVGISGRFPQHARYPAAFGAAGRRQRCLITHGPYDPVIPMDEALDDWRALAATGAQLDVRTYPKDHGIDPERELPDIAAFLRQRLGA